MPIVQEREAGWTPDAAEEPIKGLTLAGDSGGSTLMRSYKLDLIQTLQSFEFHRQGVLPKKG